MLPHVPRPAPVRGATLCAFLVQLDYEERIIGARLQSAFQALAKAPED